MDTASPVTIIPGTSYEHNFKSEALLSIRYTFAGYYGGYVHIQSFIQCSISTGAKKVDNVAVYIGPATCKPLLGRNEIALLNVRPEIHSKICSLQSNNILAWFPTSISTDIGRIPNFASSTT